MEPRLSGQLGQQRDTDSEKKEEEKKGLGAGVLNQVNLRKHSH